MGAGEGEGSAGWRVGAGLIACSQDWNHGSGSVLCCQGKSVPRGGHRYRQLGEQGWPGVDNIFLN